ncbi:MAG: mechanosensitive ion channel [Candidatus Egerieousia sp.]|nr:mechanosensitive ion channel [bacterium]MDY3134209.1 mechanosensitive ion channel [Candidatus Egerieousia sp.]
MTYNFFPFLFAQEKISLLAPEQEAVKSTLDSLKTARAEALAEKVQNLSNMSADQIISLLLEEAVKIGMKVLAAIAIYIIGAWVIKKIKRIIRKIMERRNIDPSITSFTLSFTTIALTLMLILMTVDALGINTNSIVALLAGSGLAIGMAFSGSLQNFAGGIMILVFKPFRVGDYVEFQNCTGTISSIEMTSTFIISDNGETIVLPNGTIFNGMLINHSKLCKKRVVWNISVAYGSNIELVRATALALLESNPDVLKEENPPTVVISNLGDSAVIVSIRCWVEHTNYWKTLYWGYEEIYKSFNAAGIQFPYPQLDVHMK